MPLLTPWYEVRDWQTKIHNLKLPLAVNRDQRASASCKKSNFEEPLPLSDSSSAIQYLHSGTPELLHASMQLLETILFEPDRGFYLLDYHLQRLQTSAQYFHTLNSLFNRVPTQDKIKARLLEDVPKTSGPQRVRLLLDAGGQLEIQHTPLTGVPSLCNIKDVSDTAIPLLVALDVQPIDTHTPYVTNKTTQRDVYNAARSRLQCDFHAGEKGKEDKIFDVLLYNEKGEITETSIANIAIEMVPGTWITPSLECGLLPGVFRKHLLETGQVKEGIINVKGLVEQASGIRARCFNSVRKIYDVNLINLPKS